MGNLMAKDIFRNPDKLHDNREDALHPKRRATVPDDAFAAFSQRTKNELPNLLDGIVTRLYPEYRSISDRSKINHEKKHRKIHFTPEWLKTEQLTDKEKKAILECKEAVLVHEWRDKETGHLVMERLPLPFNATGNMNWDPGQESATRIYDKTGNLVSEVITRSQAMGKDDNEKKALGRELHDVSPYVVRVRRYTTAGTETLPAHRSRGEERLAALQRQRARAFKAAVASGNGELGEAFGGLIEGDFHADNFGKRAHPPRLVEEELFETPYLLDKKRQTLDARLKTKTRYHKNGGATTTEYNWDKSYEVVQYRPDGSGTRSYFNADGTPNTKAYWNTTVEAPPHDPVTYRPRDGGEKPNHRERILKDIADRELRDGDLTPG